MIELLAATLGIARGRLSIARGESSRTKQVCIAGAANEARELRARLVAALSGKALFTGFGVAFATRDDARA